MEPVLQFLISYYTDPALNLNTDPDPAFFVTAELLKKRIIGKNNSASVWCQKETIDKYIFQMTNDLL